MTSNLNTAIQTEYDAAIMIFCLIALADNEVLGEEIAEIHNEVELLGLDQFSDFKNYKISNWSHFIANLQHIAPNITLEHINNELENLATKIESESIRRSVLSSVMRIAYADGEYHPNEKILFKQLSELWGI